MGSQEWGSVCMLRALMPVLQVRYLKIIEKSGYQALPWVRYITQNGGACDPPLGQGGIAAKAPGGRASVPRVVLREQPQGQGRWAAPPPGSEQTMDAPLPLSRLPAPDPVSSRGGPPSPPGGSQWKRLPSLPEGGAPLDPGAPPGSTQEPLLPGAPALPPPLSPPKSPFPRRGSSSRGFVSQSLSQFREKERHLSLQRSSTAFCAVQLPVTERVGSTAQAALWPGWQGRRRAAVLLNAVGLSSIPRFCLRPLLCT